MNTSWIYYILQEADEEDSLACMPRLTLDSDIQLEDSGSGALDTPLDTSDVLIIGKSTKYSLQL